MATGPIRSINRYRLSDRNVDEFVRALSGDVCHNCHYNLTGVESSRCPECGVAFNRGSAQWVVPTFASWERNGPITGLFATLRLVALSPIQFACYFPPIHRESAARSYALLCKIIAVFLSALIACAIDTDVWPIAVSAVVGCLAGIPMTEWLFAAVLGTRATNGGVIDGRHFWRGILNYRSGFWLLISPIFSLAVMSKNGLLDRFQLTPAASAMVETALSGCALAVVLWSLTTLFVAMTRRLRGFDDVLIAILGLAFAVWVGACGGAAIGFLTYATMAIAAFAFGHNLLI